jgi:uncharacterized membrane protein
MSGKPDSAMKFVAPTIYGVTAAVVSYLSTLWPGTTAAILLFISLFLWVLFIVFMLRAVKPE